MSEFIIQCSQCNAQNELNSETCIKCDALLAYEPRIEVAKYRQCLACGAKNYFINNIDPRVCWNCNNDEIQRSAICEDSFAETEPEGIDEPETVEPTEMKSSDCMKSFILTSLRDNHTITIPEIGAVLGRMGSIDGTYFSNDDYVGREHAYFFYKDDGWKIIDNSVNGTRINGILMNKNQDYDLHDGDRVSLANVHFIIGIR